MKDANGENHYAVAPFDDEAHEPATFAEGDLSVSDNSFSALRQQVSLETGIATPLVDEVFDLLAERGALVCRQKPNRINGDDSQWRVLASKLLRVIQYIKNHPTPVAIYAALHAWDVPDFDDLNAHLNQQEFAKTVVVESLRVRSGRHKGRVIKKYLTKADVNIMVLHAQKHFGLPPRRDQRNEETREKQKQVRESKLL